LQIRSLSEGTGVMGNSVGFCWVLIGRPTNIML
jgi:hypothetical protein